MINICSFFFKFLLLQKFIAFSPDPKDVVLEKLFVCLRCLTGWQYLGDSAFKIHLKLMVTLLFSLSQLKFATRKNLFPTVYEPDRRTAYAEPRRKAAQTTNEKFG